MYCIRCPHKDRKLSTDDISGLNMDPNNDEDMKGVVYACVKCDNHFNTYEETVQHESQCSVNIGLEQSKRVDTQEDTAKLKKRSGENRPKTSKRKAGKELVQVSVSRVGAVPLKCSLTETKAKVLSRLHYLLVENLELIEQEIYVGGPMCIVLRCSNCYMHPITLQNLANLAVVIPEFRLHFVTCPNTMKSTREEIKILNQKDAYASVDVLNDYCDFINDLYGMINAKDKACVQWGTCMYTLTDGYRPTDLQYERIPQAHIQTSPSTPVFTETAFDP